MHGNTIVDPPVLPNETKENILLQHCVLAESALCDIRIKGLARDFRGRRRFSAEKLAGRRGL
jgi:hypothetical protein